MQADDVVVCEESVQAAHCTANEAKEVPSLFVGRLLPRAWRILHKAAAAVGRR